MPKNDIGRVADVLAEYLADGPRPYEEVKTYFREMGVSRFELKAARRELGVETVNNGTTWLWVVPEDTNDA